METTIKTSANLSVSKSTHVSTNESAYDRWLEKLKFSYFGIIAMTITIGSILGGIAAMFIFQDNGPIWQVGFAMATAMANNVACIGQAPIKWVVNLFFICCAVNILLIVMHV